jgi:cytochrome P450
MTDHAARRKVWDAAFSLKALKGYEENVISNVELVIEQVGAYGAKGPVDVGQW